MSTTQPRTKVDPIAARGIGFPFIAMMLVVGAFAATTNGVDRINFPMELAPAEQGHAVTITSLQISASAPGDRTTGTYAFTLTRVDAAGNAIGTIQAFTVPAAFGFTTVDLRQSNGQGVRLRPGEGLRLDTGAAATGGATNASGIRVRIFGEAYGIRA